MSRSRGPRNQRAQSQFLANRQSRDDREPKPRLDRRLDRDNPERVELWDRYRPAAPLPTRRQAPRSRRSTYQTTVAARCGVRKLEPLNEGGLVAVQGEKERVCVVLQGPPQTARATARSAKLWSPLRVSRLSALRRAQIEDASFPARRSIHVPLKNELEFLKRSCTMRKAAANASKSTATAARYSTRRTGIYMRARSASRRASLKPTYTRKCAGKGQATARSPARGLTKPIHRMGGTGLEPVTPSLSRRCSRSRPFAQVRSMRTVERNTRAHRTFERTRTNANPCHSCHAR